MTIPFVGGPLNGREISEACSPRYHEGIWPGRYELVSVICDEGGKLSCGYEYRYDASYRREDTYRD